MGAEEYMDLVAERAEVIDTLRDGPVGLRGIVDRVDASRSTVNRAVRALEDAGLAERTDGGYVATLAGRVALERYREYRETVADLQAAEPALAGLDPETDLDTAVLRGCEVTLGEAATPYEPEERLHETVADADAYRGALPAVDDPRHVGFLYEHVVTDGDPADLVVAPDLFDHLAGEFPRRLAAMADTDRFDVAAGDVPPFGLVVTDHGETRRVSVVVYGEDGVHALLENDTDRAVGWAERRLEAVASSADGRTAELEQPSDGGVVTRESGAVTGPRGGLLVDLEREGFVRLSREFFANTSVSDPTTAWRVGLDLAEVHAGYAVERTREDGTPLTEALRGHLEEGRACALVGPPGSGKSTVCKQVACEWYDADRGPVLYREGGSGQPFESVESLVATVDAADGHSLVVVEDAVRPEGRAVFDAIDRLADRADASVLVDARDREWHDPPTGVDPPADIEVVGMPALDDRDVRRVVEHFERTAGATVEEPIPELREALDRETPRGDVSLLLHRLALYADPLAETRTGLEADVARVYDDLADDDLALDVATLAALLVAAGIDVYPGYLHAVARPDAASGSEGRAGDDPDGHDRVRAAVDRLDGRVLFGRDDGAYRTVHGAWATAFLAHLRDADAGARERFGRVLTAFLGLADDPERRDRVARAVGDYRAFEPVVTRPGAWADETVDSLLALVRERSQLAELFGTSETAAYELPDACSARTRTRLLAARGEAHHERGNFERARTEFQRRLERARERDEGRVAAAALNDLGTVARDRGDLDEAREFFERALDRFEAAGDPRGEAESRRYLAAVARQRGEFDEAREQFERALELERDLGNRRGVAAAHNGLGNLAVSEQAYDTAAEHYRQSLALSRELGDRIGVEKAFNNLGMVAYRQGEYDRAREYFNRCLEIDRRRGAHNRESSTLNNLGIAAWQQGDHERAAEYYRRSLDLRRAAGDRTGVAQALNNLGLVARERGDLDEAREYHEECLAVSRETGQRAREAKSLNNLGMVAREEGDLDEAREFFERSLAVKRDLGDAHGAATTLDNLGAVARQQGDLDAALEHHERALEGARDVGDRHEVALCLANLGRVARDRGDVDEARERFEAALGAFAEVDAARDEVETLVDYLETERELGTDSRAEAVRRRARERIADSDLDLPAMRDRVDAPDATD